jgi:hypothetical protein
MKEDVVAPAERCPACREVMYADQEKYMPKGTDVVYVCRNGRCPTALKTNGRYPEKIKKFIPSR